MKFCPDSLLQFTYFHKSLAILSKYKYKKCFHSQQIDADYFFISHMTFYAV